MKATEGACGIKEWERRGSRFVAEGRSLLVLWVFAGLTWTLWAGEPLVEAGEGWSYSDQGTVPGVGWQALDFSDVNWAVGLAPLGYGNGDERTQVGFGPNASSKFITTYFRHRFIVPDTSLYGTLALGVVRDDGAIVYLNGVEVFRSNLPGGSVNGQTPASGAVGGTDETAWQLAEIPASTLVDGWNILAVEVHQSSGSSSDLRFDLRLQGNRRPITVTAHAPADGAVVGPGSVPLQVEVTDPENAPMTVRFLGRAALPPGADFTVIALPDTQYYTGNKNGGTPAMAVAQIEWILREREQRNIVFVTQLGDLAESGDKNGDPTEWQNATNAFYRLEDPLRTSHPDGLAYGVAVGNHDISGVDSAAPTTLFYNQYFGTAHFQGRAYYGGHFGTNNNNHYELFRASGLDFIALHLEYDTTPDPAVLAWARGLLESYPAHRAIVSSHYLIGTGQPGAFGGQGRAIYDALKDSPNLFLMLCGHVPGEGRRADTWQGRTVHTLLSDYQSRTNGGTGWLRILEFSPSNQVVRVKTYSPILDQYETDANSEFVLDCDLSDYSHPFVEIARRDSVTSGSPVEVIWESLGLGTTWDWYVEVGDGTQTVASPVWQFTVPDASEGGSTGGAGSLDPGQPQPGLDFINLRLALDGSTGQLRLQWPTVPGRTYRVVYTDSLTAPDWTDLTGDLVADGDDFTWATPLVTEIPHRFYRVRLLP